MADAVSRPHAKTSRVELRSRVCAVPVDCLALGLGPKREGKRPTRSVRSECEYNRLPPRGSPSRHGFAVSGEPATVGTL
eukprot:5805220-Prymnesium_polylepis.2